MSVRNYELESKDLEGKKYSYKFDERMRHYAMKVFEPYFKGSNALEIGAHEGKFTKLLKDRFKDILVIDPYLGKEVQVDAARIYKTWEQAKLEHFKYDNIFLMNVLEHMDDPVFSLKKINDTLTDDGHLFLMVPNAEAISRRIAVGMGLMKNTTYVTEDEYKHGHRRTYEMGLLIEHIEEAGLNIVDHGGLFFKALCNYQLDEALEAGILSNDYMDSCLELGKIHPTMCASLYAVCKKGKNND